VGGRFDWVALVALTLHPAKVAIIEALRWLDRPLSATELAAVLAEGDYNLDMVLYHARGLVKLGFLEIMHTRRVRGANEKFYAFCKGAIAGDND
jgi:hypothetical protein